MNKIIQAGDTLSAVVKMGIAGVVVYGVYRAYLFSQEIKNQADDITDNINQAKQAGAEFVTETVNPASDKNFINDSVVGDTLRPAFFKVFDFFGVGK